jgi:methylphosphotriester-DNA--protein-cysteine methyltransferase
MNLTTNDELGRRRAARTIAALAPGWAAAYAKATDSLERFNDAVTRAHAECPRAWLIAQSGMAAALIRQAEERHDVTAISRDDNANWRELRKIGEAIEDLTPRTVAEAAIKLRVLMVLHGDGEGIFEEDGAPVRRILADLERLAGL